MTTALYTVTFRSELPDPIKVGDQVRIAGKATVRQIRGDLIDITELGSDGSQHTLGEISVDLYANTIQVL